MRTASNGVAFTCVITCASGARDSARYAGQSWSLQGMRNNPVWGTDRLAELRRLTFIEGKSMSECAEIFGVTRSTVAGALYRIRQAILRETGEAVPRRATIPQPKGPTAPRSPKKRASKLGLPLPQPVRPVLHAADYGPLIDSVAGLTRDVCKYPYGISHFKFCGRPRTYGAYCDFHGKLCYNPLPRRAG